MKRADIIKNIARVSLEKSGLSLSLITGKSSTGRKITQLEEKELELGLLTNYELTKLQTKLC